MALTDLTDPLDPQIHHEELSCPDPDCGEPVSAEWFECPNCGRRLEADDFEPPEPDWDALPGGADHY